jgi:hypothetical protein
MNVKPVLPTREAMVLFMITLLSIETPSPLYLKNNPNHPHSPEHSFARNDTHPNEQGVAIPSKNRPNHPTFDSKMQN